MRNALAIIRAHPRKFVFEFAVTGAFVAFMAFMAGVAAHG